MGKFSGPQAMNDNCSKMTHLGIICKRFTVLATDLRNIESDHTYVQMTCTI
jgi:hypothetical protein